MSKQETNNQMDLALKSLERVDGVLNFAEAKIGFIFAFISILISLIVDYYEIIQRLIICKSLRFYVIIGLISVFTGMVITIISSFKVLFPRLKISKTESLLYFGSIASKEEEEYINEFKNTKGKKYIEHVLSQAHAVSIIASDKFKNIKNALAGAVLVLIGWIIMMALILFYG